MFKRNQPTFRIFRKNLTVIAAAAAAMVISLGQPASAAPKYAGIVIDAKTGKTLYESDADSLRYPASLTKMMTLYLTFEALQRGKISLNTKIPFSAHAASEPPTKLGVKAGGSVTVETAILSLVTKSANDAATATGEFLGGSEARFASMMTAKARSLGMSRTTFKNASGLPNGAQVTTARDMARLGIALREHFPQYYGYFSTRSFTFGRSRMANHNRLLGRVRGVDGIKTGYTRASGFNLVSSVVDNNRSIVAVVLGGRTGASRNQQMTKLIATYLPKASTRGGGVAIARSNSAISPVAIANLDLPDVGPVPSTRHTASNRIAIAYATPTPAPVQGRDALAAMLTQQQASIPTPAPAPAEIDPVTTASTTPDGWQVQIGAMPDQSAASALLSKAQKAVGRALNGTEPMTMAYNSGGAQLYRARFAGFSGQNSAQAACRSLKKKGFACWATPN